MPRFATNKHIALRNKREARIEPYQGGRKDVHPAFGAILSAITAAAILGFFIATIHYRMWK